MQVALRRLRLSLRQLRTGWKCSGWGRGRGSPCGTCGERLCGGRRQRERNFLLLTIESRKVRGKAGREGEERSEGRVRESKGEGMRG